MNTLQIMDDHLLPLQKLRVLLSALPGMVDISSSEEELTNLSWLLNKSQEAAPILEPPLIRPGDPVSNTQFSKVFDEIAMDLMALYGSWIELEEQLTSWFNDAEVHKALAQNIIDNLSSKLGSAKLFLANRFLKFTQFGDSFISNSGLDPNALKGKPVNIDKEGGVATLGLSKASEIYSEIEASIAGGNGNPGAAIDNLILNSDLMVVLDQNPDTLFEYERIDPTGAKDRPLVLILNFKLSSPSIINNLLIKGGSSSSAFWPLISELNISSDGTNWINIIDELKNTDLITREGMVSLSPSEGQPYGVRSIYFYPRWVQFINIKFVQQTSSTVEESKRYAIVLRDILIRAISFVDESEYISRDFESLKELFKVGLIVDQIAQADEIKHQISYDRGGNWTEIDPLMMDQDEGIPSMLSFNLGTINTIQTVEPVRALKYRASLRRQTLQNLTEYRDQVLIKTEVLPIFAGTQDLRLKHIPLEEVSAILPLGYTIGGQGYIPTSFAGEDEDYIIVKLPFKLRDNMEEVYVNDRKWKKVALSSLNGSSAITENNGMVYGINYDIPAVIFSKKKIIVNEEEVPICKSPTAGQLEIRILGEPATFAKTDTNTIQTLNPTDGTKGNTRVFRLGNPNTTEIQETLPVGQTIIQLGVNRLFSRNVPGTSNSPTISGWTGSHEAWFIDGNLEFVEDPTKEYSIDYRNAKLYLKNALSASRIITIPIHQMREEVPKTLWQFGTNSSSIIDLDLTQWTSYPMDKSTIFARVNLVDVSETGMVTYGSVSVDNLIELDFVDGYREFRALADGADRNGYFSVDYDNGIIYFYEQSGTARTINYQLAYYEVECAIARVLEKDEYSIKEATLTLDPALIGRYLTEDKSNPQNRILLLTYKYIPEKDLAAFENFYSPRLFGYTILALNKEQLLEP